MISRPRIDKTLIMKIKMRFPKQTEKLNTEQTVTWAIKRTLKLESQNKRREGINMNPVEYDNMLTVKTLQPLQDSNGKLYYICKAQAQKGYLNILVTVPFGEQEVAEQVLKQICDLPENYQLPAKESVK